MGIHFFYNKKFETEKNFIKHVRKIEKILMLWRIRNLTVEGKITIFKTLAMSKIIQLFLVTTAPTKIISKLNKIQKELVWNESNSEIKHFTLCNEYENDNLKNVDILSKVINLQFSWIKWLYDNLSHLWKTISSYLIYTYLRKIIKFHSSLDIPANKKNAFQYTIKKYLRDGLKICPYFPVFPWLLRLKLSGITNISKETPKPYIILN